MKVSQVYRCREAVMIGLYGCLYGVYFYRYAKPVAYNGSAWKKTGCPFSTLSITRRRVTLTSSLSRTVSLCISVKYAVLQTTLEYFIYTYSPCSDRQYSLSVWRFTVQVKTGDALCSLMMVVERVTWLTLGAAIRCLPLRVLVRVPDWTYSYQQKGQ